jgi:hypothetical protein
MGGLRGLQLLRDQFPYFCTEPNQSGPSTKQLLGDINPIGLILLYRFALALRVHNDTAGNCCGCWNSRRVP